MNLSRRTFIKACLAITVVPFVAVEELVKLDELKYSIYVINWSEKGLEKTIISRPNDVLYVHDNIAKMLKEKGIWSDKRFKTYERMA